MCFLFQLAFFRFQLLLYLVSLVFIGQEVVEIHPKKAVGDP